MDIEITCTCGRLLTVERYHYSSYGIGEFSAVVSPCNACARLTPVPADSGALAAANVTPTAEGDSLPAAAAEHHRWALGHKTNL